NLLPIFFENLAKMFYEKVKYNTPLPGAEFRSRDLAIPAEATKVLYEIDFQYGRDRELCLSILTSVFRSVPQVTQILQDAGKAVQGGGGLRAPPGCTKPLWRARCACHFGPTDGRCAD